jgi:hypothetical protein
VADLPHAHELLYPFIVCQSAGGVYEDQSFAAGVQMGRIDEALRMARHVGVDRATFAVYTALVKQLELVGMACGFPIVTAVQVAETERWPAMPEWSFVTFEREQPGDDDNG